MQILRSLLIFVLIQSCFSVPSKCKNCGGKKSELPAEQMRQLRYEYLKNQILTKLHLNEAPKITSPKPSLNLVRLIAEMAENEIILGDHSDLPIPESVIVYPKNETLTCSKIESYPCSRFEFVVPETLSLENFLSAEVWFFKNKSEYIQLHQIVTDNLQNLTSSYTLDNVSINANNRSWVKYSIFGDNILSNVATGNLLVLEVVAYINDTDSESTIGKTGDEKPFLVIRSQNVEGELLRSKRSTSCVEGNESCCKETFYMSFAEIGWNNWVIHPDGYEANFCRGHCFHDLSKTRFYHSEALLNFIRENKDISEAIGLSMCCTPSVMAPVPIIYRNEEGMIYSKNVENMRVVACDCA